MKIVCISDTHGIHDKLKIPECDILIHAGDITPNGKYWDCVRFAKWFRDQNQAKHKIFIAGNHDFLFQNKSSPLHRDFFYKDLDSSITYLQDSSVTINSFKIYGTPWTPEFFNWAFMKERGKDIAEVWKKIPFDTNILIVHGPPYGILDKTAAEDHVGCFDLLARINELPNLQLCIFGHIHEDYGSMKQYGITFVNASSLNEHYKFTNTPIIIDL